MRARSDPGKGTELARAYVGTIRLKLLKIGAVIIRNTRRIRLLLASAYPYQDLFCLVAARLRPRLRPNLAPPTRPAPCGEAAPRIDLGQRPFRRLRLGARVALLPDPPSAFP